MSNRYYQTAITDAYALQAVDAHINSKTGHNDTERIMKLYTECNNIRTLISKYFKNTNVIELNFDPFHPNLRHYSNRLYNDLKRLQEIGCKIVKRDRQFYLVRTQRLPCVMDLMHI